MRSAPLSPFLFAATLFAVPGAVGVQPPSEKPLPAMPRPPAEPANQN